MPIMFRNTPTRTRARTQTQVQTPLTQAQKCIREDSPDLSERNENGSSSLSNHSTDASEDTALSNSNIVQEQHEQRQASHPGYLSQSEEEKEKASFDDNDDNGNGDTNIDDNNN